MIHTAKVRLSRLICKGNDRPCPDRSGCGCGTRTHSPVYEADTQKTYYTKST